MYTFFYHLQGKPFTVLPDPSFLWLGPKYAEALSVLRYGLLENKGLVLLTGDGGSGKTTLINALTGSFDQKVLWAVVGDPGLERLDFYNAIAKGFGIDREFTSKVQFLLQFSAFLHKAHEDGKRVVLLVDDCQRLSQDMLEELRLLSNIARADARLINIFFVGRREFLDTLIQPNNRAVRQRLTLKAELVPLSHGETHDYIRHRLKVAGTEDEIFTAKAIEAVHCAARGNPRLINLICDLALTAGATAETRLIGRKVIEDCLAQLNLPQAAQQEDAALADKTERLAPLLAGLFPARIADRAAAVRKRMVSMVSGTPYWRWVKYVLGIVLIGAAVLFFLFLPEKGRKTALDADRPAVHQPAEREKVGEVDSSAVTVGKLEPIGKAINLDMVAERKQTPVKKEHEAEEIRPGAAVPEEKKEEVPAAPGQEPATAAIPPEEAGTVSGGKPEEKAAETPVKPAAEQAKSVAVVHPMQPTKVVLPLRANSLELTEEAAKDYREFIARLQDFPKAKLLVKGFVSAKTNSPENVKLSEERAMGVQKLLVKSGIAPSRITVKGMGNQEPLAPNDTSEGRTKNRRVEVVVVSGGR